MSFVAVAIGGAALIGAGVSVYEDGKTRSQDAAIAGNAQAIAGEQFSEQQGFEQQLAALIANPSSITSTPGYQFQFDQGGQAVARSSAAGGFLNSGNEGIALTQYGQNYASSALTQQESLLASLSGLTTANLPATLNAGTNANTASSNALNQLLSQLGYGTKLGANALSSSGGTPSVTSVPDTGVDPAAGGN